jgi:hypothetical protein
MWWYYVQTIRRDSTASSWLPVADKADPALDSPLQSDRASPNGAARGVHFYTKIGVSNRQQASLFAMTFRMSRVPT